MPLPSAEQLKSFLRIALAFLGGTAITAGWLTQSNLDFLLSDTTWTVLGTLVSIGTAVWSQLTNRKSALVAKTIAIPEVQAVLTTPTLEGSMLANSVPSEDVRVQR